MRPCLRLFPALCILSAAISCSRSREVPSGLIQKEQMGRILYDIGLAEGSVETEYYRDSSRNKDSLLRAQLDKVMAVHGTSREDFQRSYDFYKRNPHIFKEVVDTLQARAQRNQQRMFQGGRRKLTPELKLDKPKPVE
jgi:hypothetical protein